MVKGTCDDISLYRTEKWELKVHAEQEKLLIRISDGLREIYNWGRQQWMEQYAQYREEKKAGVVKPKTKLATLFDQINLLTGLGEEERQQGLWRGNVPRNWKEETLDSLHGALSSFFSLIGKGDRDARPPRERDENYFSAVPGRSGFSLKGGQIVFAPNKFGKETLSFPVPGKYQAVQLARATKLKKFVISRDERNLREPGRYWVSLSYEIPKPPTKPFAPEEAVFIALGASSIGVVSRRGEEVIPLWRSDKYWVPKIREVEGMLAHKASGTNIFPITKRSKRWRKLESVRAKKFRVMSDQQTQNRREVVAIDLIEKVVDNLFCGHGVHFVVTELVVRSKEGKLADASKEERGGPLGLNWAAQNTGSIGYLVRWLEEKAPEYGGTVRKHKLPYEALPDDLVEGHENKIPMARALRDDFLRSYEPAA